MHEVQPTYYYGHGVTPFGNPITMNAEVAVGALLNLNRCSQAAPFNFRRPTFLTEPPIPHTPVRYVFRSKKFCVTCGWRKQEHLRNEGAQNARETCKQTYCGNCYRLKEHHKDATGNPLPFGPECTFATNPVCRQMKLDWYEKKVRLRVQFFILFISKTN
jgi:hypothetical protein